MSGYPLGSPELRAHVHDVVDLAVNFKVHRGILRATGCVVPRAIGQIYPELDEWWPDR